MLNKKIFTLKDRPELQRNFMLILCFVSILLLFCIVGVLLVLDKQAPRGIDTSESDAYFSGCTLLEADCADVDCGFYASCGDDHYKVCRIYDCAGVYGIFTKNAEDKIETKNEAKPDQQAIAAEAAACTGTMEVLNKECTEGKEKITLKLQTAGDCEVGNIALVYGDEGGRPSEFSMVDADTYQVVAETCDEVTQIIPASASGMELVLQ